LLLRLRPLILGLAALCALAPLPGAAAAPVQVLTGTTPDTRVMPSNAFTVADSAQLTGLRINLPLPSCGASDYSTCDDLRLLNLQDGFDLRPRVTVPFSGPINVGSVTPSDLYVAGPGGFRSPITQLVWDPLTNILAGEPADILVEATGYRVVVGSGIRDAGGQLVGTCGGSCSSHFTTQTATPELALLRTALDSGAAYSAAGIGASERGASFVQGGTRDVFAAPTVTEIDRGDQVYADTSKALTYSSVLNSAVTGAGYYVFGSFLTPRYQSYSDAVIAHVPSWRSPASPASAACWPTSCA
jgi:hypothetical protein